ncbi:hypothetical protein [Halosegnis marinus]|uniref:Uncharacterized protein n=1 Tax=Halosegnis marinus TaxID=3034023 RepID=A0ABD5ZND7_9EURY|nr:hypothetical protein [Halosegnis sp. DT85]
MTAATPRAATLARELRDRLAAARPMAAGGLATLLAVNLAAGGSVHGAIRPVEYALLAVFLADLGLDALVEGLSRPRLAEAAVVVPYAALVVGAVVGRWLGCGLPPALRPLAGTLEWLHGATAVCRELVPLEVVAGAGVLTELSLSVVEEVEFEA